MSKTNQNNWAEALAETLSMAAQDIHDIVHLTTDQLTQKTGMSADQILDLRMAIAKASGLEILDCPCCDAVLDFNYCHEALQASDTIECPFCGALLGKNAFFADKN